jgi:hypothetical protein
VATIGAPGSGLLPAGQLDADGAPMAAHLTGGGEAAYGSAQSSGGRCCRDLDKERGEARHGTIIGSSDRSSEACFGGRWLGEDST